MSLGSPFKPGVVLRSWNLAVVFMVWVIVGVPAVRAQAPKVAPRPGVLFHDQQTTGTFQVQRWVDAANPEVSPSGMCDCVTVVYLGERKVLTIDPGTIMSTTVETLSG